MIVKEGMSALRVEARVEAAAEADEIPGMLMAMEFVGAAGI